MSERRDDELQALLQELAPTEAERAALLEEHRLLEKDLGRLADPLPPIDFVQQVMAKVASAPARVPSRSDVLAAGFIVATTLAIAVGAFFTTTSPSSGIALSFAQAVLAIRELVVGIGSATAALWRTAAGPMVAGLAMMLVFGLYGLRRLTPAAQGSKVTS